MADPKAPVTAAPAAPQTPAPEAPKTVETKPIEATPVEKAPATPAVEAKVEAKADAAAEATGAEKVATDKYEIKVDGEALTLSKDEMIKWAQLGKAGQKRMQEAIEFQKQTKANWENLQKALKENPESILEDAEIGHNKIELAKKWLAEKLQNDAKSPEQLELEKLRAETAAFKKEKEDSARKHQEEMERQQTEQNIKALETEMISAFKKYQLPNSSAMVDRMTGIMEVAEKNNIQVSVDDVAKIVRDEIKKDIQELASMLPEDEFEALLGEAGIKRIKDSTLKKMKAAPKVEVTETGKSAPVAAPVKKMTIKDFMKPDFAK